MSKIHVFTSAAYNYIPKVRLLFNSLRKYHPEFTLHLVLADEVRSDFDISKEPFDEIITLEDLEIPNLMSWIFEHDLVELATAIKPFALKKLLGKEGCEKVLYIDPDIVLFSRLDEILSELDGADIALTPHQTEPDISLQAIINNEICSLKHGIYNLGFLGVSATKEGIRFAQWWADRTYHFCRDDIPNGLFTDQRWIDLVPAFFANVGIIRSSRFNVAPWNLTNRILSIDPATPATYLVNGQPLGFYHFTGFDSGAHRIMSEINSKNNEVVKKLVDWYAGELSVLADDKISHAFWAYGFFSNGEKIKRDQRLFFRLRNDLKVKYKNPYDANIPDSFLNYWNVNGDKVLNSMIPAMEKYTPFSAHLFLRIFSVIKKIMMDKLCRKYIFDRLLAYYRSDGVVGLLGRIKAWCFERPI